MQAASRSIFLGVILAMAVGVAAQKAPAPAPPKTVADSVNEIWTYVEQSFIALADAMPEDKWSFKPSQGEFKDVRTFGEQVKHVACGNEAWAKKLRGEEPPARCDLGGPNPAKTKAEIIKFLKDSYAMGHRAAQKLTAENVLEPVTFPMGKAPRLYLATLGVSHANDHYGQMVEYLRMNGIVSPASRGN